MTALFRAELLKQRSTVTTLGLLAAMLALVSLAELLHGFGLAAENLSSTDEQLTVLLGRGQTLGAVFAALLGAMSITAEFRHGTIRPTLLANPTRVRVIVAKVGAGMLAGAGFGFAACALAVAVGTAALRLRGIDVRLDPSDFLLLLLGSAAGAALWATIGVGVGAALRNQVTALVGLCTWLLFVEALLAGDLVAVNDITRLAPGAAAAAITGQDQDALLVPAAGLVVLAAYAGAAAVAGVLATVRRDVA